MKDRILRASAWIVTSLVLGYVLLSICGCAAIEAAGRGDPQPLQDSISDIAEPVAAVVDTVAPGSGLLVKGAAGLAAGLIAFFAGRKVAKTLRARSDQSGQ